MNVVCSGVVLFLLATGASGQLSSAPPEVTVLAKKWRVEVRNPLLEKDPFQANKERQQEELGQKAIATENENRIRQGEPVLPPTVRVPTPETGGRGLSVAYVYEVKVINTGRKEIRTLTWEYVFFEFGTPREVGRLQIVSKVSMKPGTTKNLIVRTTSSPTATIEATRAGKKTRDQYSEQIVIRNIKYADGSVWPAAGH